MLYTHDIMNVYGKNKNRISEKLLRIMSMLSERESKPRSYGTDTPLFDAEIHLIKTIKENEGSSVTALAETMNVTKGAVSQILTRLDKKEMIRKEKDEKNQSRVLLYLSSKGETAYVGHKNMHSSLDDMINGILQSRSEQYRTVLADFLSAMESGLLAEEQNEQ